MSKLYNIPVDVRMAGGTLAAFLWHGKWVKVVSCTPIYQRRYTNDPFYGMETYRVKVQNGGVYELVKDGANWVVEKVWD
ncbi:MAG: hypothetical protein ACOY46_02850 [Bacillota bacterium]